MLKILFIIIGSMFLCIGAIGIVIPGLPATPFFILSAAFYLRGSEKLHTWILNHRLFGKYIKIYYEQKAMTVRSKVVALSMMWVMIFISVFIFIENVIVKFVIILAGIIGTIVISRIRVYRNKE